MLNKINIQTLRWELNTDNLLTATEWQDKVSYFSNFELQELLEKSLFAFNPDNEIITIDKIELDLEWIQDESELKDNFKNIWNKYLNNQLEIFADKQTGPGNKKIIYAGKDSEGGESKDNETESQQLSDLNFLRQFCYFLLSGSLPWNANEGLFINEDLVIDQFLVSEASKIHERLFFVSANDNAVIRLISFFDETNLKKLIANVDLSKKIIPDFLSPLEKLLQSVLPEFQFHRYKKILLYKKLIQYLFSKKSYDLKELIKNWWLEIIENGFLSSIEIRNLNRYIETRSIDSIQESSDVVYKEIKPASFSDNASNFIEIFLSVMNESVKQSSLLTEAGDRSEDSSIIESKTIEQENDKSYFISNAGIVLLYPYITKLFKEKNFLTDENKFTDKFTQMQASRLLQFIAFGNSDFKEYHLVLNKVLCGYSLEAPVIRENDLSLFNKNEADDLLKAAIKNWSKIGNTSPDGFRGSFLLRKGKITDEDNNYILHVERKGWDVLLESLPYTINIIKLPWMQKPLYVEW